MCILIMMKTEPLIGSHMSIARGMHNAFSRGESVGCATMQVFVKNNNRWVGKTLTEADIRNYRDASARSTIKPVIAHATYLINLCATNTETLNKSRETLADELTRCEALSIKGLVFHPGAHVGAGEDEGIKLIAESINVIHHETPGLKVFTTLETTAGQGTTIGYRLEHLQEIIEQVDDKNRMAICLDTCHVFAAGYDISTENGWNDTLDHFEKTIGLQRLLAIHVNDSKRELGSRVDRHEHIGKGLIGLDAFRFLMNDPRLTTVPKILETDKSEDLHEDVENLAVLRSLIDAPDQT